MKEFLNIILGELTIPSFLAYGIFIWIGWLLVNYFDVIWRDKSSLRTPEPFDLKFWVLDNYKRVITFIIIIFIVLRFYTEIYGNTLNAFNALLIGTTFEGAIAILRQKSETVKKALNK
jgi:hypothetical protein